MERELGKKKDDIEGEEDKKGKGKEEEKGRGIFVIEIYKRL